MIDPHITIRLANALFSLYMLLILLRWLGPWIQMNFYAPRLRWIPLLTDPPIQAMRRVLPPMGPMDFGPLAVLVAVWIVKVLTLQLLVGMIVLR